MALGILDTFGLAGSLIFAIPLGVFGIDALLRGRTFLGAFCVVVAAAMVALPHYLTTPTDVVEGAAQRAAGKAVKSPEEPNGGGAEDGDEGGNGDRE
jgi:hypothetical protein